MNRKNPPANCLRQLRRIFSLLCMGLAFHQPASAETTNETNLAVWDVTGQALVAIGYRDNVLRSSVAIENSGFIQSSLDASLMRLSTSGSLFMFYLLGEDTRYFDAPSVNYEQFFSGTAHYSVPIGSRNEAGLEANYLYQHQILDVSETEVFLRRVLVLGHGAGVRPHWKHSFNETWDVQLEGAAFRQIYETELDDYWEADGKLNLTYNYGNRSEASISYQLLHRFYDTREQFDESGMAVANTSLDYRQNEVSGQWRHNWDAARHWRTTSRVGYMLNRDNGSGYFDYERLLLRQQIRWGNSLWNIKANARFGWYLYKLQEFENDRLERSYVSLDLRVERRLGEHWMLHAVVEREWNMSNDPLDEYRGWMASFGVGFEL